mgnify:CR=1 FL=1
MVALRRQMLAVGLMCIMVDYPHALEASRNMGDYFALLLAERRQQAPGELLAAGKEVPMWRYNPWANTWYFVPVWTPPAAYLTPWGTVGWWP